MVQSATRERTGDRRALASVGVQFLINGVVFASFVPRLPELRDRFDVSLRALGVALTLATVVGVVGSFFASQLIERVGSRRALIAAAIVLIATLPVVGFAPTLVVFGIAVGVMHAADVVVDIAMNLQGSWLSARRPIPVMNRLHGLWSLGTVAGGVLAAQLVAAGVSLRIHLIAVSVVLLAGLTFVAPGLLREDEPAPTEPPEDGLGSAPRRRIGALVAIAAAGAFAIAVEMVSSDWAAFRLRDDLGTSLGVAGLGFVAYTTGMTIGRFGGDLAQSRLGQARLLRIAVVVAGLGLAGASFAPNAAMVLASYVLAGLGNATMFPMLYDRAAQLPGARGAGLGALTAGSRLMFLAAPLVIGVLASTSLSVGTAIAIVTLPSLVGFAVLVVLPQRAAATSEGASPDRR